MEHKKISMKTSILWNSWGSIFYLGCQWLLTVLVVRLAGVEESGILSLAMSVSNIWYSLAVYGMRNYQVSDVTDKYKNGTYIFSRWITGFLSLAGCVIYTAVISYSLEQKLCILIYFLYKLTEAYFDIYAGIYQKEWRMDFIGKSMTARGVLTLGSFTVVLGLTGNMVLTLAVMAATCAAFVILYDVRTAGKLTDTSLVWDRRAVWNLLKECSPLVVYTLLSTTIGTIPRIIMERYLGSYQLGIYGSVATPTLIIQMGATYIFNPFVTLFGERYQQRDRKGFGKALRSCCLAVAAIAAAGLVGGRLLGHWGLNLLYGQEVAAHEELLLPLIFCTVLTAFAWLLCGVLTAVREFRGLVWANVWAVICSAAASLLLERSMGMQGASLALALATVVEIAVLWFYLFRKMRKNFQ